MTNIKAIIFDMDNTLLDRTGGCHFVYEKMLKDMGVFNDPVELEAAVQDCLIWDLNGTQSRNFMAEKLQKKYGIEVTNEKILEYWFGYIPTEEKPYKETVEVLNYLKKKYKLALLTNGGSANQWNKIEKSGIKDFFDEIVVSGDVGLSKPDTKIFELTLNKLAITKEEAIFVGDTYSTDILGAYKAGIRPIWICPNPFNVNNDGIERITLLKELSEIL